MKFVYSAEPVLNRRKDYRDLYEVEPGWLVACWGDHRLEVFYDPDGLLSRAGAALARPLIPFLTHKENCK